MRKPLIPKPPSSVSAAGLDGERPLQAGLPGEEPLGGTALTLLVLSATAVTAVFYLGCLLALLLVGALLLLEIAAFAALLVVPAPAVRGEPQPRASARDRDHRIQYQYYLLSPPRMMIGPIQAQANLASLLLQALNLKREPEYSMPLRQEHAPDLFALVERMAGQVHVGQPDQVVLGMHAGAWVRLGGYRRGRGHCTLGLGFDLLAVLAEAELEAVVAHEMAHAKLIQRGYKGWLANAVARMVRLTGSLAALCGAAKGAGRPFQTAALLARGSDLVGRKGVRLFAAYSRQDEFAADRIAADLCGADACRRALIHTHVAHQKALGLEWRDRLVQLQRPESFSEWVHAELTPRDEAERVEREARACNDARRGEFDTHPATAHRLANLVVGGEEEGNSPPALGLLRDPDGLAARLLSELEQIANERERQASRHLRRQVRKQYRSWKLSTEQEGAVVLIVLGAVFAGMTPVLPVSGRATGVALWLVGSLAVLVAGVWIYRKFPFREQIVLPVPAWSQ